MYGYQIVRLPKTSFFYEIGARKGDIIRRLQAPNHVALESNLELYSLLLQLEQVPSITVSLEREGRLQSFYFYNKDKTN